MAECVCYKNFFRGLAEEMDDLTELYKKSIRDIHRCIPADRLQEVLDARRRWQNRMSARKSRDNAKLSLKRTQADCDALETALTAGNALVPNASVGDVVFLEVRQH